MAAPLQAAAEAGDPTSAISLAFHVPPRRYHQVASLLAAALSAALRPGFDFGAAAAARRWEASSDVSSTSAYSDDGDAADMEDGGAVEAAAGDDCQSCSGGGGVPPPAQGAPPGSGMLPRRAARGAGRGCLRGHRRRSQRSRPPLWRTASGSSSSRRARAARAPRRRALAPSRRQSVAPRRLRSMRPFLRSWAARRRRARFCEFATPHLGMLYSSAPRARIYIH